ncbi:MAG: AbrB family transcriptional regulator [Bacillota bacterium]
MFSFRESWFRILITLLIASVGGLLLEWLGVPAGLLVGSTIFVASISVADVPVSKLSPRLLDLLLVFIGITVADNIRYLCCTCADFYRLILSSLSYSCS